jgi:polyribonucleotide nucleotidyltransferase
LKFCPNIAKIEKDLPVQTPAPQASIWIVGAVKPATSTSSVSSAPQQTAPSEIGFSIKDIKIWQEYDGYIKLSYNYGMFVTVKWVEWLLHKNFIVAPAGVERKKYYNIGDKIKVKAKEFKEINGEQKVVRAQK